MSLERKLTGSGETVVNVTDGKSGGGCATSYVQVVGRYGQHTLDQCHTVATALGNAIRAIEKEYQETDSNPNQTYMQQCIDDAAEELRLVNERLAQLVTPKMTVSYSGQTSIGADGVPHTYFQNGVA